MDLVRRRHQAIIEEALVRRELQRQSVWTESIAVGDEDWVNMVGGTIRNRMAVVLEAQPEMPNTWRVREARATYSA